MNIQIKPYSATYLPGALAVWNEVVTDGIAFPQEEILDEATGHAFFSSQTHTAVAVDTATGNVVGMYILHPNNVGRCGHISNASFAVSGTMRGQHIGEKLVQDCLAQAKAAGFSLMQFNAVVDSNIHAHHLYQRLGFQEVGRIPGGFRMKDGHYEDIHIYYHTL